MCWFCYLISCFAYHIEMVFNQQLMRKRRMEHYNSSAKKPEQSQKINKPFLSEKMPLGFFCTFENPRSK